MYNDASYNDASYRPVRADVKPTQPLPVMYDSHGNAVRVDPSQLRKVKGGYELMEATLSGPSSQQQKPQQRRASGIPQRVPAKIVRPVRPRHWALCPGGCGWLQLILMLRYLRGLAGGPCTEGEHAGTTYAPWHSRERFRI